MSEEFNITLDEDTHLYRANGIPIPGVTSVLSRTGIVKYPNYEDVKIAMYRGRVVHKAIELYEQDRLVIESLSDSDDYRQMKIRGYFDAFLRFRENLVLDVLGSEEIVGHKIFWYAGKLDMRCILKDGRVAVVDFKTGPIGKWVELQTAAYLEGLLFPNLSKPYTRDDLRRDDLWHGAVRLNSDGTHDKPYFSQNVDGFPIFLNALAVVNYCDKK